MPDDDPILTITDFRRAFCSPGIEKRLQLAGIDIPNFLRNGARASALFGHGYDAHVQRVIDIKRASDGR